MQNMNLNLIESLIKKLWKEKSERESLNIAIELANEVMFYLGINRNELGNPEMILENAFPSSQYKSIKNEPWYKQHPFLGGARVALYHYNKQKVPVESNFFFLNDSNAKSRIAVSTQLTTNFEDGVLTRLSKYKVGIDFILNSEANGLFIVLSERANIRVLELSERLTHNQREIFELLYNCFNKSITISNETKQLPQEIIHKSLWDAFEVQELNKQFYSGVADHFVVLVSHLNKNIPNGLTREVVKNNSNMFAIRLIGRILFLWFLRKKGKIINEDMKYFEIENLSSEEYYETRLKPLFFETLNTEIDKRKGLDKKTPYLNGGLFEPHDNDWVDNHVKFPKNWFNNLYDHFNKFNFTVDESTPEYTRVAVDPEMLGRVFENLLATVVDETGESAKKAKGTFYTPRSIVNYMCKESLKEHLITEHNNSKDNDKIIELIDRTEAKIAELKISSNYKPWGDRTQEVSSNLINIINDIKVLDPAVGSGAFPIAFSLLLVQTLGRLSAIYDESLGRHRLAKSTEQLNFYDSKFHIMQNNIFGSDIEPMAIEIAKLRSWLSLIIDDDAKNLKPLPNLDFKYVCTNSLVNLEDDSLDFFNTKEEFEEKYTEVQNEYFYEHDLSKKLILIEEVSNIFKSHINEYSSVRDQTIATWNPFINNKPANFFDSERMFGVKKFDIVIGNPPYVQIQYMKKDLKDLYKSQGFNTFELRGDMYALFYEQGIRNLKENGILCYITSNKWMRAEYGASLRNYFFKHTQPLLLLDLGGDVFENATVDTNILLLKKGDYNKKTKAITLSKEYRDNLSLIPEDEFYRIRFKKNQLWLILNDIERSIKEKIEKHGKPLGQWQDIKINRGILTGLNDAFIINEETRKEILDGCMSDEERKRTDELIRPILRGRDIVFGGYNWDNIYLINTHNGYTTHDGSYIPMININILPSIKKYLDGFYDALVKRQDQGDTPYNLRGCAYMDDFEQPKIVFQSIMSKGPRFALDLDKRLTLDSCGIIVCDEYLELEKYLNTIGYFALIHYYSGGSIDKGIKINNILKLPYIRINHRTGNSFEKELNLSKEEIEYVKNYISACE
ncbi:MAG: class I SAM-dependent DNA methyltransferase [Candidatus Methanofastidiosa archaeon]|nr:class I SAM-dependent DNA methyltransferase [Candidatus Methanofastidiosa archaeon]